jgi:hypothetical protein
MTLVLSAWPLAVAVLLTGNMPWDTDRSSPVIL